MTTQRTERVAALIQQEISTMLVRGLKAPRIGFVTITGAKVSPDLREAWVYYAVHGDEKVRADTAKGLDAARGFIRRELGKALKTKVTPELHFVYDEAIEHGDRIERLIKQVHEEEQRREQVEGEQRDPNETG
ncbi:MAG TPA: 30S ribosome-binding factor RbfA [Myxococcales bacterium]|jgi:ribosome-binding factor A|nr:30S ribosome-binding factor RbfA [Myxococcales bacterium]